MAKSQHDIANIEARKGVLEGHKSARGASEVMPPDKSLGAKKKVLLVITKSNWGGAQKYVFDLATGLDPAHFDVSVALGGTGELKQRLEEAGVPVISINGLERDLDPTKDIGVYSELLQIYKNVRPDVIHLNSSKIGGIGAVAARMYNFFYRKDVAGKIWHKAHIVFTAHGWAFNEDRTASSKLIISYLYWLTIMLAHRTITVSQAMKNQVRHYPFVQSKISVIHNGISPVHNIERNLARTEMLRDAGVEFVPSRKIIGTIAELHKIKGLNYAIEAIDELVNQQSLGITASAEPRDFLYIIIGAGEERAALQAMIEEKNLQNSVLLLGHIQDAARYLKAFDIFLLPSLSEGLAYVLLEAGLAGLPVIATQTGGIPEIIRNSNTGILVPIRDPRGIANAITRYLDDPKYAVELSTSLNKEVSTEFSKQRMIEKTVSVY